MKGLKLFKRSEVLQSGRNRSVVSVATGRCGYWGSKTSSAGSLFHCKKARGKNEYLQNLLEYEFAIARGWGLGDGCDMYSCRMYKKFKY